MKWSVFLSVLLISVVIVLFEWKKLKSYPKKDKISFFTLLTIACVLSIFDLQNMSGPVTLLEYIFKPLGKFMEK
ncbi:hypothetical protein ACFSO7_09810 [Bacillus sp. CGMCC 1.16607]|uniref:hypothetical protein n=1 Tax=Bacillus sp. CGMCC 1.16607 TaxID=3351842 RepID=UPI003631CD73